MKKIRKLVKRTTHLDFQTPLENLWSTFQLGVEIGNIHIYIYNIYIIEGEIAELPCTVWNPGAVQVNV